MIASEIKLYEVLKTRIGDKEAAAFVEILDKKVENKFVDERSTIVSEIDAKIADTRAELLAKIADTRAELLQKISDTRADLVKMISDTRAELLQKIGDTKAEIIKWMFIFWVGQVAVTFGFILLFLKK
jgi:hypothetical protein